MRQERLGWCARAMTAALTETAVEVGDHGRGHGGHHQRCRQRLRRVRRYEAELSWLVGAYPQSVLCLYDVRLIGGGVLFELLRAQ